MGKIEIRDITLANFNCTFGAKNEPMLSYFDSILYPAFTANEYRKNKDSTFFFINVRVIEYEPNEYVLTGNFVKETMLEVKNHYDPKKGLTSTYELYPTSPYSIFVIFLKNHRMAFYRNQKGSPLMSAFKGTAQLLIKKYLNKINKGKPIDEILPAAYLKILPIPSLESILSQLKTVDKINSLTLNLFPLNGDIGISETFDNLRSELTGLDTNTAKVTVSTPKNIQKTAKLIANTQGTIDAVIRGINGKGDKVVLHNDSFTETLQVKISAESSHEENTLTVINTTKKHQAIKSYSKDNELLYAKSRNMIESKME